MAESADPAGHAGPTVSGGPAVPDGPTEGVPCWTDVQLPDVEAGKRFYGRLFGWTFDGPGSGSESGSGAGADPGPAAYTPAHLGGKLVAALAPKGDGRMPTAWTVYLACADAAGTARRIRELGGQVITDPVQVDGLGTTALAADPEGAVFALWQPGAHRGFGLRHAPGSFCRAEVYSRDPGTVAPFYGALLGGPGGAEDGDVGRSPLRAVFPAEMPPHFLVHFQVDALDETLRAVTSLGGRIQSPLLDTAYGRVAVVTDNQGASFAVLER
ncbi:hydrolase [Streptomyces minutiscleroticus]|uniref:Hydrolase n=1 Tax=Streptomyces minutiscleroticus TaxID=68238 RepID=A0A918KGY6_9ACTN|nr:VOC family protein [Streptomyces minutiscleroticus]GGX62878.1 hydrolase [Streptomyces minutiscleroticus]